MRDLEIARLSRAIRRRYSEAYKAAITDELRKLGYSSRGDNPAGSELEAVRQMVERDVKSIINTFHTELKNHITRLLAAHPEWSPQQFKTALDSWQSERTAWKTQQIIDASRANAGEYARQRFFEENRFTDGLFAWDATPAIVPNSHQECIRRVRQGLVTWEIAQKWKRVHPNCRHRVRAAVIYADDPTRLWVG